MLGEFAVAIPCGRCYARRVLSSTSFSITHRCEDLASSSIFSRQFGFSSISHDDTDFVATKKELLSLEEVERSLNDVGADDVKVIPAPERCEFTDYMVITTGRSPWHVRNISQALIYKVKQKLRGASRMLLPTVVGQEGGKWIAIDSGKLIVHAVDEKAKAYYNFEGLWTSDKSNAEQIQDLEKAFVKVPERITRRNLHNHTRSRIG